TQGEEPYRRRRLNYRAVWNAGFGARHPVEGGRGGTTIGGAIRGRARVRSGFTGARMATEHGEYLCVEHRGCRLAYWTLGGGPPVLFAQGVGVHGCGWRPQVDGLADRFRCVWFDNRGVGLSQPTGVPVTADQMADDARAVLDAAGWASAHIV